MNELFLACTTIENGYEYTTHINIRHIVEIVPSTKGTALVYVRGGGDKIKISMKDAKLVKPSDMFEFA